ncbi:MAG: DUF4349 domain-containing protein [Thermoleophilia bacterium]|nr:DUF4349 domain-containing protein [Thermoleophilia bacterium]
MSTQEKRRSWAVIAAVLVLIGAATMGLAGCGGEDAATTTGDDGRPAATPVTAAPAVSTTWAAPATTVAGGAAGSHYQGESPAYDSSYAGSDQALAASLTAIEAASGQKIISDAQLEIEVEQGKFQTVFNQAVGLANRYAGYLVNSNAHASGEEDSMRSGSVSIRVPSKSFNDAFLDASKLGTLKDQDLSANDVTEEYVDLQARIQSSEANVASLLELLGKAKTVDEILYVRSVLNSAQQELESLKGRMRYLEEHTSYSTITMSIYEVGVEAVDEESWGFVAALKDGARNLVKAFSAIVRALGIIIPVLIVVGIIAYIVYLIIRAIARRNRAREEARYQPRPEQGWRPQQGWPANAQPGAPQQGGVTPAAQAGAPEQQGAGEPGEPGKQG